MYYMKAGIVFGLVMAAHGAAIPIWELLTREEKVSTFVHFSMR